MKFKHTFFLTQVTMIFICGCAQVDENIPPLQDQYFGQTPPGVNPEIFAPGMASDESWAEHCQVAVSPLGDEIFWSAWTGAYKTEDGKKLFFYQVKSPWVTSTMNTYYVEKTNGKWSDKPIDVGQPYNSEGQDYSPMFTKKGNAYKSSGGIVLRYRYKNNQFALADTMVIHEDFRPLWNIYVSPLEDYVIFAAMHEGGFGDVDLYISFKTQDSQWGAPLTYWKNCEISG